MNSDLIAYLAFGGMLVLLFLIVIIHYYSGKRKDKVESPKYRMLEDDDE